VTVIERAGAASLAALPRFGCTETTLAGAPVLVARTGYTGEDGFELFVGAGHAAKLWQALLEVQATIYRSRRSGSVRATRFVSRPGCRSTGTSSAGRSRRSRRPRLGRQARQGRVHRRQGARGAEASRAAAALDRRRAARARHRRADYPVLADLKPAGVVTSGTNRRRSAPRWRLLCSRANR